MLIAYVVATAGVGIALWIGRNGGLLPFYTQNHANLDIFWATFWATLFATAIVGTIGAFAVGYGLSKLQLYWQKEAARRTSAREFAALVADLRYELWPPSIISLEEALSLAPREARAIIALIRGKPLALWRDDLPDKEDLFLLISAFENAYWEFVRTVRTLDTGIQVWLRENRQRDNDLPSYAVSALFMMAHFTGLSETQILGMLQLPQRLIPVVKNDMAAYIASEEPPPQIWNFQDTNTALQTAVAKLRAYLVPPPTTGTILYGMNADGTLIAPKLGVDGRPYLDLR